jgi:hypothetical protein
MEEYAYLLFVGTANLPFIREEGAECDLGLHQTRIYFNSDFDSICIGETIVVKGIF